MRNCVCTILFQCVSRFSSTSMAKLGVRTDFFPICCDFDSLPNFVGLFLLELAAIHPGAACEEPCWIGNSKRRRVWRMMPMWISQAAVC